MLTLMEIGVGVWVVEAFIYPAIPAVEVIIEVQTAAVLSCPYHVNPLIAAHYHPFIIT